MTTEFNDDHFGMKAPHLLAAALHHRYRWRLFGFVDPENASGPFSYVVASPDSVVAFDAYGETTIKDIADGNPEAGIVALSMENLKELTIADLEAHYGFLGAVDLMHALGYIDDNADRFVFEGVATEHTYMNGRCWEMAIAIHQVTDLPLQGLYDNDGNLHHAFVWNSGTHMGLDARGWMSPTRLRLNNNKPCAGQVQMTLCLRDLIGPDRVIAREITQADIDQARAYAEEHLADELSFYMKRPAMSMRN